MKFYYIDADVDGSPYAGTLANAKQIAREEAAKSTQDVQVHLVEVSTSKDNMLRLLNNTGGYHQPLELAFTAKAKLKEENNG